MVDLGDQKGGIFFNSFVIFLQEHLYQIANNSKFDFYNFTCEVHTENPRIIMVAKASTAVAGR